jgi:hypothetical protein
MNAKMIHMNKNRVTCDIVVELIDNMHNDDKLFLHYNVVQFNMNEILIDKIDGIRSLCFFLSKDCTIDCIRGIYVNVKRKFPIWPL